MELFIQLIQQIHKDCKKVGLNLKKYLSIQNQLKYLLFQNQVPIVILGNKIDKPGAIPEEEFRTALGINVKQQINNKNIKEIDGRPVDVFMCSVANRVGYAEGFRWLS